MEFAKIIRKWNPITSGLDIKNIKLNHLVCIFMEWYLIKNLDNGDNIINDMDLSKGLKDLQQRILLYSTYKEVKVFLNEFTGQLEYMIDGKLYSQSNNVVTVETIIQIFGEDFYNFLIEEEYDFKK